MWRVSSTKVTHSLSSVARKSLSRELELSFLIFPLAFQSLVLTFLLLYSYDGPGGGSWTPVYRSKHVKNNLNPKWEPATIDVNSLCDGDLDRRIQVAIFDHESKGKHETMGTFECTGML